MKINWLSCKITDFRHVPVVTKASALLLLVPPCLVVYAASAICMRVFRCAIGKHVQMESIGYRVW